MILDREYIEEKILAGIELALREDGDIRVDFWGADDNMVNEIELVIKNLDDKRCHYIIRNLRMKISIYISNNHGEEQRILIQNHF